MRGFLLAAGYLIVAVLCGSLLALVLMDVVPYSYDTVLSRSVLIFAALGLFPLWKMLRLTRNRIGVVDFNAAALVRAFLVGLVVISPVVLFYWVVGFRVLVPDEQLAEVEFLSTIVTLLVSATLVAAFEELLFRGVLLGALWERWGSWVAIFLSSFIYAGVHYLGAEVELEPAWYAGFEYLALGLSGLAEPALYWDSFVSLFLLGVLFCVVRVRWSLWWCMGLHAGFVFVIRMQSAISDRDPVNALLPMISDYDHFVGHIVSAWVLFLLLVLHLDAERRRVTP